jgi:hypothetical protein
VVVIAALLSTLGASHRMDAAPSVHFRNGHSAKYARAAGLSGNNSPRQLSVIQREFLEIESVRLARCQPTSVQPFIMRADAQPVHRFKAGCGAPR